jgi:hypothetical protein
MVDWAVVDWGDSAAPFHLVDCLDGDGCDFYTVFSATPLPGKKRQWTRPLRLLYVGLAYHQTVHERIKQDHQSYDHLVKYFSANRKEKDFLVMLGRVTAQSTQRRSEAFVKDVEGLLIFSNQPKFNTQNRQSYNGRHLVVMNNGRYEPLKRCVASSARAATSWNRDGGQAEMETALAIQAGEVCYVVDDN